VSADGLERVWFLNTLVVIQVPPERGTDGLCVMEHRAPVGDSPPLHVHHNPQRIALAQDVVLCNSRSRQ
jgi:hypothetical protein